jgi:uncharacterized protein
MRPMSPSRRLALEFILIFIVAPFVLALLKPRGMIYWILWIAAFTSCYVLEKRYGWKWRDDWNWRAIDRRMLAAMFRWFAPLALALFIFALVTIPDRLFSLPLERPRTWLMVMVWYPLLSVVPQEVIFRSLIFRRYATVFTSPRAMIAASAIAFGWMHIVLMNWVAVLFSAAGGVLFAYTYHKTRSLAAVWLEHALYGCFIFTLGMGYYFYHGLAVR